MVKIYPESETAKKWRKTAPSKRVKILTKNGMKYSNARIWAKEEYDFLPYRLKKSLEQLLRTKRRK